MNEEQPTLNREYIGKTYDSGPHIVESNSIREYALATNETNPLYLNTDSHELTSPPLYPVVFIPYLMSQLVDDAESLGLDRLRVVHSQHTMKWNDLLRSGDQVSLTATIADMKQHGIHDTLDLEIAFGRENDIVVEIQYQILVRGVKKSGATPAKKQESVFETGVKLGQQSMAITEDQGLRYAKASGDHNPIHVNEEIAKIAGFPKTIVHGLCTMAFASKAIVEVLLDGHPSRLKYMSNRFSKPVFMGQTVTTEFYDVGMKEDFHVVHYVTKNPDGVPVLTRGVAKYSD